MARPPVSEQVQVNFRMPADLKERIEIAAKANSRSTTAEIVATLEDKYPWNAFDAEAALVEYMRLTELVENAETSVEARRSIRTRMMEIERDYRRYAQLSKPARTPNP